MGECCTSENFKAATTLIGRGVLELKGGGCQQREDRGNN